MTKDLLRSKIQEAWQEYHDLHRAEAETGYDNAMDGFERKEAEGFALGLTVAYELIYNEFVEDESLNPYDPYEEI